MVKILSNKLQQPTGSSSDTARLSMMYGGSGRRISKTFLTKSATAASWDTVKVTRYTGIGTEVREEFHNGSREKVNVVVNMPQGLGRYKVADASQPADDNASRTFEWYLKNHLGSTMLVYGTVASTDPNTADIGETKAAYDYRAFGEMVTLSQPSDKVTENFTGKERDDETKLNYFGARYLDPMLGMWISVDPYGEFFNSYSYGPANPVNGFDGDGNIWKTIDVFISNQFFNAAYNAPAILAKGPTVMGKTTIAPDISQTKNLEVRHVVQEWRYDPSASDEENAKHNYGARRIIDQVEVPNKEAVRDFMIRRQLTTTPLYDTSKEKDWMPFVFNEEPLEMPEYPVNENANPYVPNGNVTPGELQCDDCRP